MFLIGFVYSLNWELIPQGAQKNVSYFKEEISGHGRIYKILDKNIAGQFKGGMPFLHDGG